MKFWHQTTLIRLFFPILAAAVPLDATLGQNYLLVDDFESSERNYLGGRRSTYERAPSRATAVAIPAVRGGNYGRVLRLQGDRKAAGFCGAWLHLFRTNALQPRYFDATPFKYLSFWVRGHAGGERLTIKLADQRWIEKEDSVEVGKIGQYLPGGITQQWQEVLVPLAGDQGLALEQLGGLTFDFDLPGQHTVYVDNVAFKSARKVPRSSGASRVRQSLLPTIASRKFDRALWVWTTDQVLDDTLRRDTLFTFCRQQGISQLWMQLLYEIKAERQAGHVAQSKCVIQRANAWERLLRSAHDQGLEIHALAGYPEHAQREWHHISLAIVEAVIDFNRGKPAFDQFDGVHFDNEPHLLVGWHDAQRREQILFEFLSLNAECQRRVRATSSQLKFGIDIPFWWQDREAPTNEPVGNVTFRGQRRAASYHAIDLLDNVGIMNYRDRAHGKDGMIAHGRDLLKYADEPSQAKIYMGVETFAYQPTDVIFVVGLSRDRFHQAIHGSASNLAKLSHLERHRLRVFDDGKHLHVGIELPDGLAPANRERVTRALSTIGEQLGMVSASGPATVQRDVTERFVRALKKETEWSDVRPQSFQDPRTGTQYPLVRATVTMPPKLTFANDGVPEFIGQLQQAEDFFGQCDNYAGIAVHHYETYRELIQGRGEAVKTQQP